MKTNTLKCFSDQVLHKDRPKRDDKQRNLKAITSKYAELSWRVKSEQERIKYFNNQILHKERPKKINEEKSQSNSYLLCLPCCQ